MSSETPKNHVSDPKDGDFRLSNASLDRLPGHIRRPAYDRSRRHAGHRPPRNWRVPPGAPGGGDRRPACGARRIGESSGPACEVRTRAMPSRRRIASTHWPFVPARAPSTGSSARCCMRSRQRETRALDRAHGRSGDAHRLADGHREGLLPHAANRRPGRAIIPTSFMTCKSRHAALGHRISRGRAGAPADCGRSALHRSVVRQSLRQWPYGGADRDAVRRLAIAQSRQMDRSRGGLPFDHGGPDRAGDHRPRPSGGFRPRSA